MDVSELSEEKQAQMAAKIDEKKKAEELKVTKAKAAALTAETEKKAAEAAAAMEALESLDPAAAGLFDDEDEIECSDTDLVCLKKKAAN